MAESLYLLSGQTETFGDQIVPDADDCFLAPADVSAYSSHVSVVCLFHHFQFCQTPLDHLLSVSGKKNKLIKIKFCWREFFLSCIFTSCKSRISLRFKCSLTCWLRGARSEHDRTRSSSYGEIVPTADVIATGPPFQLADAAIAPLQFACRKEARRSARS